MVTFCKHSDHLTLKIMNPGNTFGYTVVSADLRGNYNLTLPLLTANDTVAVLVFCTNLHKQDTDGPHHRPDKIRRVQLHGSNTGGKRPDGWENTTDTLTNKILTAPTISTIANGSGVVITLPTTSATLFGTAHTATLTNKTYNTTNNTLTTTSAVAGALLLHNGTKYDKLDKGANGTFLGVSGGSVGYFTPKQAQVVCFRTAQQFL